MNISLSDIDALIFDFDGVLTNNRVYLDQGGRESVSCSRSDGLGFDVLRKLNQEVFIVSTEKNPVVTARAEKLKVKVLQGVSNKVDALKELVANQNLRFDRLLYVGNDLNDFRAMSLCGYSACPADSHNEIKKIATITLKSSGGNGVVRELLEDILELNFIEILYPE